MGLSANARRATRNALEWLGLLRPEEPAGGSMSRKPQPTAPTTAVRKIRCAVYTRKSTDEGLEKEFNSLDAQRESCEAYIASQRAEGWVLAPDRYDDGGVSLGTLERPALQRLLGDIERDRIDVVVVYKIDRLSRSLMHFSKLVEAFDAHNVTFVSVTQSFNTTTSMGRLTLNILLSFAQFEREVIGERIRDKVAASKARGMWMGGSVPLGYDVRDRKLVVNEAEAARAVRVFEGFADIGSATLLVPALRAEGVLTKTGKPFDKGSIYKLLSNRTLVGEVAHKGNIYPGEHRGIIPRDLWDRVHAAMQASPRMRANQNRRQTPALLCGLIFGPDGRALSPTHTRRKGKIYRYYVSQTVLKGVDDGCQVRRISAGEIESAVIDQVRTLLRQPEVVIGTWRAARVEAGDLTEAETREALERLDPLWEELFPAEQAQIVQLLVERMDVSPTGADIRLRLDGLANLMRDLSQRGIERDVAA
jgi:DNA invertase Pin-like site-specific DNA recombinase